MTSGPPLDPVVAVPNELELEDRLAGPVTFRMAGWLVVAGVGAALVVLSPTRWPILLLAALLLTVGLVGAFARPQGRPVLTWLRLRLHYLRRQRSAGSQGPARQDHVVRECDDVSDAGPRRAEPVAVADGQEAVPSEAPVSSRGGRTRPGREALLAAVMLGALVFAGLDVVERVWHHHSAGTATKPTELSSASTAPPSGDSGTDSTWRAPWPVIGPDDLLSWPWWLVSDGEVLVTDEASGLGPAQASGHASSGGTRIPGGSDCGC